MSWSRKARGWTTPRLVEQSARAMKVLSAEQNAAKEKGLRIMEKGRKGFIFLGGTGSGKTLLSLLTAHECAKNLMETKMFVLCIVPSMGETVFDQFKEECDDQGFQNAIIYHGGGRLSALQEFRRRFDASDESGGWFVISSIHTLHADAVNILRAESALPDNKRSNFRIQKCSAENVMRARKQAIQAFGKVDIIVIDEFQEFRNGSPGMDARCEVDMSKTLYVTLDQFYNINKPLVTIGLSATPFINTSADVYSFLRFVIDPAAFKKENFMQKTMSREAANRVASEYVVKLKTHNIPETTQIEVPHTLGENEVDIQTKVNKDLYIAADQFMKALSAWLNANGNQRARLAGEKDKRQKKFFCQLTVGRRTAMHPALSEPPMRADPALSPVRDAAGEVLLVKDDITGAIGPIGTPLPLDVAATVDSWPLKECSKMNAIVERLKDISEERVLILFAYADPCNLLAEYLRRSFPERQIFVYHGGVSNRSKVMQAFKTSNRDAICVATRGSCEKAVNIDCTTTVMNCGDSSSDAPRRRKAVRLFLGDLPLSHAEKNQAEGRTKRPMSQGYADPSKPDADRVTSWYAETIKTVSPNPTIEDFQRQVINIKQARTSDFLRDDEMIAESLVEKGDGSGEDYQGILKTLLDTFGMYKSSGKRKNGPREPPAPSKILRVGF